MKVSDILKEKLSTSPFSINYIASKSNIPQSSLSRFHSEKCNLSLEAVNKLCDFFNLTLVEEIHWPEYSQEAWEEYATEAWIEYRDDAFEAYVEEAWQEALQNQEVDEGDFTEWQAEAYEEWEAQQYPLWEAEERPAWETRELERLSALPWVRIVND